MTSLNHHESHVLLIFKLSLYLVHHPDENFHYWFYLCTFHYVFVNSDSSRVGWITSWRLASVVTCAQKRHQRKFSQTQLKIGIEQFFFSLTFLNFSYKYRCKIRSKEKRTFQLMLIRNLFVAQIQRRNGGMKY